MQISSRHREGSRETARPFRPWSDLRSRKSAWAVRRKRLPGGGLRAEGVGAAQDGGPLPGRAHPEARDGDQGAVSDICCCRGSGSEARGPRAGGGSSRDAAPRAWLLPARGPAAQASGRAGRGGRGPACEEWVGVGDAALPSAPDPGDAALPLGWGRGPRAAGFAPTFEFRPLGGAGKPGGPASDLGWRGGACEVVQRQRGAGVEASGGLGGAGAGREAPRVGPGCRARTCCRPLAAAGSPGRCSPSSGRAPGVPGAALWSVSAASCSGPAAGVLGPPSPRAGFGGDGCGLLGGPGSARPSSAPTLPAGPERLAGILGCGSHR